MPGNELRTDDRPWYQKVNDAARYYLGPAYEPVQMAGNALAALSPGADMIDMYRSSGDLMKSRGGWDTANALGGLGAAALGAFVPGTARGIAEGVDEAAGAVTRAVRGSDDAMDAVKPGIRAFHGSPHDFDAFSMDKIGTGEGAQAYGHGLYFADKEGVARSYRDTLSADDILIDGRKPQGPEKRMVRPIVEGRTTAEDTVRRLDEGIQYREADPQRFTAEDVAELKAERDMWQALVGRTITKNPGHMYEVNINASPADFLDWDKPLSEQSEKVRGPLDARLREYAGPAYDSQLPNFERKTVGELLDEMKPRGPKQYDIAGRQNAAMREGGVAGIKYLDNGSRATGEGSHNYVVFDEKLISIMRKYGLLGAAGLGGAGYMLGQETGDDGS